jgi:hypothetical protein
MVVGALQAATASAVAAALAAGAAIAPMPWAAGAPAIALLGLVALAFVARPKAVVGASLVLLLFVRTAEHLTGLTAIGNADEVVVLALVAAALLHLRQHRLRWNRVPGTQWFLAFVLLGVLSGAVRDVPPALLAQGTFLACKGFMLAFAIAQFHWRSSDVIRTATWAASLTTVALAAAVVQAAAPETWSKAFQITGAPDRRGFLPSLIGPFIHPGDFALAMSCASIGFLAWRLTVCRSSATRTLLAASFIATLLTFRRRAAVGCLLALLHIRRARASTSTTLAATLLLPIIILAFGGRLASIVEDTRSEYLDNPRGTARVVITVDAPSVAAGYFPLGAGFTRFGSYLAGVEYSPEYSARGYEDVHGLTGRADEASFLTDTFWPAVLGETGYLGMACFILFLWKIYRQARRAFMDADSPHWRWLGLTGMGFSIHFLVDSLAAPVYYAAPGYVIFFATVGILSSRDGGARTLAPSAQAQDGSAHGAAVT